MSANSEPPVELAPSVVAEPCVVAQPERPEPSATLFEVREFSLFDGCGVRTTVFFKGCPLRCPWCHNPEGLAFAPEILFNRNRCSGCGACRDVCPHSERCTTCGRCAAVCAFGARRVCGFRVTCSELLEKLLRQSDVFRLSGGGVTFSGGEPLAQAVFVREMARLLRLHGIHTALETSGCVSPHAYRMGVEGVDFVFQDLKHPDPERHRHFTGGDLGLILENVAWLARSGKPYIFRIPLVPNVNDSPECLEGFARIASRGGPGLLRVEFLPYHTTAGAKYHLVGREFQPEFDVRRGRGVSLSPFQMRGIPCKIL